MNQTKFSSNLLWILAGERSPAGVKQSMSQVGEGVERSISDAIASVRGFDFAILDTAPGWDSFSVAVLFYADEILTPVSLESLSVHGLLEFQKSVKAIRQYQPELRLRYILLTFMDGRVRKSEEILDQLTAHFGELVCQPIHFSVRLSEALAYGQTILEYAPSSPGVEDYRSLARRISNP